MTTTHQMSKSHGHAPGATHTPEPHDPEHDIDAKSTTIWVVASSIVLFLSLYFLLPLFDMVMTIERDKKVNNLPAAELEELLGSEHSFLRGDASRAKKSIEQVMQEMVPK